MDRITIIYSLVDPKDGKVFYVGRTSMMLSWRLRNHVRDAKKKTTPKALRIAEILQSGSRPTIHEIVRLDNPERLELESAEQAWIDFYSLTHKLTNIGSASKGGTGDNARIELTPELISRLGTEPDSIIARDVGCDRKSINYHRTKLGIPVAPRPNIGVEPANKKHLPEAIIQRLGTISDAQLAKESGVSHSMIERERIKRSIPACPQWELTVDNLPTSIIERLGTVQDGILALEAGISSTSIKKLRYSLGIPSWRSTANHPTSRKKKA